MAFSLATSRHSLVTTRPSVEGLRAKSPSPLDYSQSKKYEEYFAMKPGFASWADTKFKSGRF
jgi:hypothetical protein